MIFGMLLMLGESNELRNLFQTRNLACLGLVPQSGTRLLARSFQGREEHGASPRKEKASQSDVRACRQSSRIREKRPVRVSRCDTLFRGIILNALTGLERPA